MTVTLVGGPCAGETMTIPDGRGYLVIDQDEHTGVYRAQGDGTAVWQGWGSEPDEETT